MFFFDEHWYTLNADVAQQVKQSGISPEQHFYQVGARAGLTPNRYFDEGWYQQSYPDVRRMVKAGTYKCGFHHYIVRGAAESRSPNAFFNEKWYLSEYPDVAKAVHAGHLRCGYEHYLTSGELEGRSPNPGKKAIPTNPPRPRYAPVVTRMPQVPPVHIAVRSNLSAAPKLNVALPSLQMKSMSGGPNTVLNLAYRLAAEGIPLRLMSFNMPLDDDATALQRHLQALSGCSSALANVEITTAGTRNSPASVGENDIFMATAWWTAQMVTRMLPFMRKKRYWYVIQDFEPGLHEWGSDYAMALETYSHDILPIVNTNVLKTYFVRNRIGRFADPAVAESALVFEPAVDKVFFAPEPPLPLRPRRLLFYSRPTVARRNLFEIGLAALEMAASEGIFSRTSWEILYIGEDLPCTQLSGGQIIRPAPWLSFEGYARLIRQSDVLLSLMLSPHPSYPPLEMARSGGLVVTNTFDCKCEESLALYSPHIIAADPFPSAVARGLQRAVARAETGYARNAASHSVLPSDWKDSFRKVIDVLCRTWASEHARPATT